MKQLLFLLVGIVFFLSNSFACSCNYQGSFLKLAPNTSFIALIKVKKLMKYKTLSNGQEIPLSMQVKVVEIYKGTEKRKTITVWGDNGNQCRPYLNRFSKDGYYIIAFIPAGRVEGELKTDYAINNCGSYWLSVNKKEKTVMGDIESENQTKSTMDLINLKMTLQKISK